MRVHGGFNSDASIPSDDSYSPPSDGYYICTITRDTKDNIEKDGSCVSFSLALDIDPAHRVPGDSGHTMRTRIPYYEKDSTTVLSSMLRKLLGVACNVPDAQLVANGFNGDPIAALVGQNVPVYWASKARTYIDKNTGETKQADDCRIITRDGFQLRRNAWLAEHGNKAKPSTGPVGGGGGSPGPSGGGFPGSSGGGFPGQQTAGAQQQASPFGGPQAGGFPAQGGNGSGFAGGPQAGGFPAQGGTGFPSA